MTINQLIGIGLRHPHYQQVVEAPPPVGWFEVHSENFFQSSGSAIDMLCAIRKNYPISLHGVGLSLGSANGIQENHLNRLKQLISCIDPCLVSEHLSWGQVDKIYLPDLLPIPYTKESLDIFCNNVNQTQEFLNREILIENPSSYLEYKISDLEEADFLVTLCQRTGAKILLDINNIYVSSMNHGWNPKKYIEAIPTGLVKEIHVAGHSVKILAPNKTLLIDTHDHSVCPEVWALYREAINKFGPTPTLLEWDTNIPSLDFLIQEASKASLYANP